jgi:hypothetical protein
MLGAAIRDRDDVAKLERHLLSADVYLDQIEVGRHFVK